MQMVMNTRPNGYGEDNQKMMNFPILLLLHRNPLCPVLDHPPARTLVPQYLSSHPSIHLKRGVVKAVSECALSHPLLYPQSQASISKKTSTWRIRELSTSSPNAARSFRFLKHQPTSKEKVRTGLQMVHRSRLGKRSQPTPFSKRNCRGILIRWRYTSSAASVQHPKASSPRWEA